VKYAAFLVISCALHLIVFDLLVKILLQQPDSSNAQTLNRKIRFDMIDMISNKIIQPDELFWFTA